MLLYAVYVDGSCSMFRLSAEQRAPLFPLLFLPCNSAPLISTTLPSPVVHLPLPLPFQNINPSSLKLRLR
ncbi:uncharacterized protein B0T23DRAFT_100006 [Neurospora hispaniola]|uniref:Uncharacterized protein n=1 Tax=Neurospora hispaniola TaxID=588809 RepID=A0AAJ0IF26_9PEZI|nr:hypothetical protein B0T23DRAFT_100006 [Neurospora hispaniola]